MGLRFRLGPFTLGRSGGRLSVWKKWGGISLPLWGKSKNTFGIVRAGPLRWHFSKNFYSKGRHQTDTCGFPMRGGLYKCPHCGRYAARKTNIIGKLKLSCHHCGTISKLRKFRKIKTGLIFRKTIANRAYFTTKTPIKGKTAPPRRGLLSSCLAIIIGFLQVSLWLFFLGGRILLAILLWGLVLAILLAFIM